MTKPTTKHPSLFGRAWRNKPIRWSLLGILLPISAAITAYAVTTSPDMQPGLYQAKRITEVLPPVFVSASDTGSSYWTTATVLADDSLSKLLARNGVSEDNIHKIVAQHPIDPKLANFREGQTLSLRVTANRDLSDIQYFDDDDNGERNLVAIEKHDGKWRASTTTPDMETLPTVRSILVRTSPRGSLAQAGVPVEIRESLSDIFADKFNLDDLPSGSVIHLLYSTMYYRGEEMATGDIQAAEVRTQGKTYRAYYFAQDDGQGASYYDNNGKPLQKQDTFNVQPVAYTRISSPFGMRYHPVLHTMHMHTGIDYAAPAGTPVHAPADGVIEFRGWKGGYGNTIMIRHSNGVETLYGHLSAFSPATGAVRAGDIIGYVGSTGRSTGPHLHYEARINSQPVNPTTVALPAPKLTQINMAAFRKKQKAANKMLATIRDLPITVAQID